MSTPLPATPTSGPRRLPVTAGPGRFRARRTLWIALTLSVLIHAVWSLWPVEIPKSPDETVLSATLTEMPAPPPLATAPAATLRAKPRRVTALPSTPAPSTAPETSASVASGDTPATESAPAAETTAPLLPAPLVEPPIAPPPVKTLPPRLELEYKLFLGTQGFLIGAATYRFEHTGNQYRIATVAEARGIVALLLRGRGKVESRGLITPTGLQPLEFAIERGSSDRREVAHFDWESGVATLHEDKMVALEASSFDPMTALWQAYFTPPETSQQTVNLVTTRRVLNYTVERDGTEKITWPNGDIETERWQVRSEDGRTHAYFWLAPQMHYVMVKMRVSQTARGTVEALLDAIRVDEPQGE
jgi:Protein of unknown function (DUF3108)